MARVPPVRRPPSNALGSIPWTLRTPRNDDSTQDKLVNPYPEGVVVCAGGITVCDELVKNIHHPQKYGEEER